MGFIIYGQSKAAIGVDEVLTKCPSCEKDTWQDLMVESLYFHIFWIPLFPFTKVANLICQECGLKRYGCSFNSKIIFSYQEIKHKFRHPIRTYTALLIISILILGGIVTSVIRRGH
jgi:hypothetical protein